MMFLFFKSGSSSEGNLANPDVQWVNLNISRRGMFSLCNFGSP